jgi:isopentenyl-diphosphate delta-isomerase
MAHVVLLTDSGHAAGLAVKATVHHRKTPLHLAFSCYLFNGRGEVLVTRRAMTKPTWPGVWTNTCCGHPRLDEDLARGVRRRLWAELGIRAGEVDLVLPRFRHRAAMANGVMENAMCPVFRAYSDDAPRPAPREVSEARWMAWEHFQSAVLTGQLDVSPWCASQMERLAHMETDPRRWRVAQQTELPPAARLAEYARVSPGEPAR